MITIWSINPTARASGKTSAVCIDLSHSSFLRSQPSNFIHELILLYLGLRTTFNLEALQLSYKILVTMTVAKIKLKAPRTMCMLRNVFCWPSTSFVISWRVSLNSAAETWKFMVMFAFAPWAPAMLVFALWALVKLRFTPSICRSAE